MSELHSQEGPPPSADVIGMELEALRREVERLRALTSREQGLLEAILLHSPHGVIVCDAQGRLVLHNRAAERIWAGSATAERIEDWTRYRAFHPDGRMYGPGDWAMARCLATGEVVQAEEVHFQRFDGTDGILLGSCAPIYGPDGKLTGALSVFADISAFKELEAAERRLLDVTQAINRAAELAEVYEAALAAVCRLLGVEQASFLLLDPDRVMRFKAWRGLSARYRAAVEGHSPWAPDEPDPSPITVADVEEDPAMAPYRALFAEEGIRALAFIPLVHQRRLLGKFMVYSARPRQLSDRELQLASTVAALVSQAVVRAQLLEAERRARAQAERSAARTRRLQTLTALLSRSLAAAEIAEIVIDEGTKAVGAQGGALWLLPPDGPRLELLRARGYAVEPRASALPLVPGTALGDAILRGEPLWLETPGEAAGPAPAAPALPGTPPAAVACLPLRIEGRTLGGLAFSFAGARRFDDEERALLVAISQSCAQALERARLFEVERQARLSAQDMARAREEILGVVSHELRNPLASIRLAVQALGRVQLPESCAAAVQRKVEVIEGSTAQMERLIADLLDLASIQAGRLAVDPQAHAPADLIGAAMQLFAPAAEERALRLRAEIGEGLPAVFADRERIVQVLANLLSNAVKVVPAGGAITVRAEQREGEVLFSVSDTGPGIGAEELRHIFQRYWRGATASYRGTGLGLSIARGIVEAHRGRIWAESALGVGSTFYFTVPVEGARG